MFKLSTHAINGLPMAERDGIIYFYDLYRDVPAIYGIAQNDSFKFVDDPDFNITCEKLSQLESDLATQLATLQSHLATKH